MAEAAGLAIGTVALIGTFKDCIDVYGMIVSAHSLTVDAELLNTKLDVERMLFLQWADRIGMSDPKDYDRRLDDPDLNRTIARVLESIKRLLNDGKTLRDRYGLIDYQEFVDYQAARQELVFADRLSATAGSTRLQKFIERFNRLSLQTGEPKREHSVVTRFKWVVKDKEKFASLMDELSYFVSRLNALIPAQEQSTTTMTKEDLAQIRSIPQLNAIVKASIGFHPQIVLVAQQMIRCLNQGRVLDRLWFRWIDDRKAIIKDRHFRTLDWALHPPKRQLKWDNLAEWLKSGSGLYWLAGKPGSGKSTLMKYLSDNLRTISLLKGWAGESELVRLQFFFYALGSLEQKSQEGLLRSLLYQFLDTNRDLIEQALPATWKEATITENTDQELAMPSISEMQTALLHLTGTISADKNFCILIDGLDEFDGKHATIAALLSRLERLPNVKIIVSSRPLPVFVSALGHSPKMYLQDLTKKDIETYIDDTILRHPYMAQVTHGEKNLPMKIASLLVEKASGVFLWVVLACQSILQGFEDYETVSELMSRISELPPELGDFFRQIIAGVEPRKRDQSARLLRLIFESQMSSAYRPVPAMGLAIVEEQGLRTDFMGPSVTELDLVGRCRMLEGRLRSRCSGLLELQVDGALGVGKQGSAPMAKDELALVNSRVVFMHRSLYELLCTEGIWEWDVLRVDNKCGQFEPHAILASLWTQLAGLRSRDYQLLELCLRNGLLHNSQAEATNCPPEVLATNLSRIQGVFAVVEEFGRLGGLAKLYLPHQPKCREGFKDLSLGLALAAEFGMVSVIQFALEEPDELRRRLIIPEAHHLKDCVSFRTCPTEMWEMNSDRARSKHMNTSTVFPLLYHATCRPFLGLLREINACQYQKNLRGWSRGSTLTQEQLIVPSSETVKYLLEEGHDPNESFLIEEGYSTNSWIEWLSFIGLGGSGFTRNDGTILEDSDPRVELLDQRAAVTLLLVNAGAELGSYGTEMHDVVNGNLSLYISNAAQRSGRTSMELARSDDSWLKVRDRILSLRTAASQRDAHS